MCLRSKDNQRELYEDVKDAFLQWDESAGDSFETVEKSHGRIETRRCWTVTEQRVHRLSQRQGRMAQPVKCGDGGVRAISGGSQGEA